MLNGTLPIFKTQENLDLIRSIPIEVMIALLVLFIFGQILRSSAIFSLSRGLDEGNVVYSFIPLLRLPAYLQILMKINPNQFTVFGKKLPIPIIAFLIQVALVANILLTNNFSLFLISVLSLIILDVVARKVLIKISEKTQVSKNPLWGIPLIGSFLIFFRKQKQLIMAL